MGICYASYGFALYGKVRLTINLYNNASYIQRVVDEQPFYLYRLNEDSSTTKFDYKFDNMVTGTRTYTINALIPSGDYFYMNDDGLKLGTIKNNGEIDDIAFSYTVNKNMMYNTTDIIKSDVVVNEVPDMATVLYWNGKLIINEPKENRAINKANNGNGIYKVYPAYTAATSYDHSYTDDETYRNRIKTATFDTYTKPTTCNSLFKGLNNLESVDLSNLDTTISTSFFAMFESCYELTAAGLDISLIKVTSNATVISGIFNNCRKLVINSDLEHWDTSNVTNFGVAFSNIANTTFSPKLDTSSGTSFNSMFGYSSKYEVLDLSTFDTSSAENFHFMFYWCDHLTTIYAKPTFVQPTGVVANNMFGKCDVLVGGAGTVWDASHIGLDRAYIDEGTTRPGYFTDKDLITYKTTLFQDGTLIINEPSDRRATNRNIHGNVVAEYDPFDTNHDYVFTAQTQLPWYSNLANIKHYEIGTSIKPTSTAYWFSGATLCESVDLTNLDTSLTTNMSFMFMANASPTLDLTSLNTSRVTNMEGMLSSIRPTTIDVSNFNTSNVTNMKDMFFGASYLTSLDVSNFDTSNVTNFDGTFAGMIELTSLNITGIDTTSATTTSRMFSQLRKIGNLDVSGIYTPNVTDMDSMFSGLGIYSGATFTLDCSHFDTSKVTNMFSIFSGVTATSINVSTWDTSNVTNMSFMFSQVSTTELDLSSFDTSKVTNMSHMFQSSANLVTVKVNAFDTGLVSDSNMMFTGCNSIRGGAGTTYNSSRTDKTYARNDEPPTNPGYFTGKYATVLFSDGTLIINEDSSYRANDIANHGAVVKVYNPLSTSTPYVFTSSGDQPWANERTSVRSVEFGDTIAPTSMAYWFHSCTNLNSISFSSLDSSNVEDFSWLFFNTGFTTFDGSGLNVTSAKNFAHMFRDCANLTGVDLSSWTTPNLTNMESMFRGDGNLTGINLTSLNTSKVTTMANLFDSCVKLSSSNVSLGFNCSSLLNASSMFRLCVALTSLNLSAWDMSKVTNFSAMFTGCSGLTTLNANFSTTSATNMAYMFNECGNITSLNIRNYNTSRVTNTTGMFFRCNKLVTIYASNTFVTSSITSSTNMFTDCTVLRGSAGSMPNVLGVTDKTYARIDGGTSNPGYFTA